MKPAWIVTGALLASSAGCGNSTPPPRAESASGRTADRAGGSAAEPVGTASPADGQRSGATQPGTAPAGAAATGVVSNEGIRAFEALTAAELAPLRERRVLWGHQSVGENLLGGARQLGFEFRSVSRGADYGEARWGEAGVADNGDPERKIRSFVELMVGGGIGRRVEAASFKFCWVDFDTGTDVEELGDEYDAAMRDVQARFPSVRLLHVTPPLTTDEPELNGVRWRFGRELIRRHRDTGLVFDLGAVISTDASGQQCKTGNQRRLCPGWASDSGHLNDDGSQRAAKAFLYAFHRLFS
jgi:hypothetical protein